MVEAGWLALAVKSKMQSAAGMGRTHLPDLETLRRWWQQQRLWGGMGDNIWALLWDSARRYR